MAIIKVNKNSVDKLCHASTRMFEKANNLTNMTKNLKTFKNKVNELVNNVKTTIQTVDSSISLMSSTIAALSLKITEQGVELLEKTEELASMPKMIPTPAGLIPNPLAIALAEEIALITEYIKRLKEKKEECNCKKNELQQQKNSLETTRNTLNKCIKEIESLGPLIEKSKNILENNSKKAIDLLKKISELIVKYLSIIPETSGDIYSTRSNTVSRVDSGELILGQNGAHWTREMGNYGEMRTSTEFKEQGYVELTSAPMSLTSKIGPGIDHIFYKDDKYIVVDSKSGPGAHLGMTKSGPQLSDAWIEPRLDKSVGKDVADIIREKMLFEKNKVFRMVSKVDHGEKTIYILIDEFGQAIKEGATVDELLV